MMDSDFITILQKELKEIALERSSTGSGLRPLILVAVLGIFVPLQMGPERFFRVSGLLPATFFAAVVVTAVIADSFAGERERHTLETLLATRLSDRSILFGKIAAAIAYGWLISISCVVVGTIAVNISNRHEQVLMFHDAASWLVFLLGPPLVSSAIATAGVLVSLRATTVRAAQQTLGVGLMVAIFATIFAANRFPVEWKEWLALALATWPQADLVLAGAGVVLAIDLVLLFAAIIRFQRAKLVLD
jgi:ABC-2 type transport system permease protein